MRRLWVLVGGLLLVPGTAQAKWTGDLRMCGADGCRMVERHLEHDSWPLLATLSTWPSDSGPAPPGPFYRLTIVPLDEHGRPNLSAQSAPIFLVPKQRLARNSDGSGGVFWVRLGRIPEPLAKAARALRPFPAPRVTRAIVGNRVAADPHSYLRLLRLASPRARVADPAGPRPGVQSKPGEIVSYWERVRRVFVPIRLESRRETPWSDFNASLWVGRRLDLIMRDGEIVRIPHALAECVRRGESLC